MLYDDLLKILVKNPETILQLLDKELSLPNIPTATMGGEVFWETLANYKGWRVQQNMFTKHARILRPDNVRVAWGTIAGMQRAMERIVSANKNAEAQHSISPEEYNNAANRLKQLKELLDIGAITQEEYEEKKKGLIKYL